MSAPAPGTRAAEVVAGGLRASPLAAGIWRRYVTAPGVIDVGSMLARPRQIVGLAGERLPLLSSVLGAVPRRTVTTAAGPEAMPLPRWGMSADSGNAPGTAASGFSSRSQALPPTPALAEALGVSPAALASVMGGSGPTAVPPGAGARPARPTRARAADRPARARSGGLTTAADRRRCHSGPAT